MLDNWGLSHHKILENCDRLGNIVRKGDSNVH